MLPGREIKLAWGSAGVPAREMNGHGASSERSRRTKQLMARIAAERGLKSPAHATPGAAQDPAQNPRV